MARAADRSDLRDRVGKDVGVAQRLIGELVHEARICAVLEQPPHEISEQIAVPADRRVDAATITVFANQPFVEPLAHAM